MRVLLEGGASWVHPQGQENAPSRLVVGRDRSVPGIENVLRPHLGAAPTGQRVLGTQGDRRVRRHDGRICEIVVAPTLAMKRCAKAETRVGVVDLETTRAARAVRQDAPRAPV